MPYAPYPYSPNPIDFFCCVVISQQYSSTLLLVKFSSLTTKHERTSCVGKELGLNI
ncbi:hypothetical protein NUACC26_001260 [Scytonema sp. NUACC26]